MHQDDGRQTLRPRFGDAQDTCDRDGLGPLRRARQELTVGQRQALERMDLDTGGIAAEIGDAISRRLVPARR